MRISTQAPYLDRPTIPVYRLRSSTDQVSGDVRHLLYHVIVLFDHRVFDLDYTDSPVTVSLAEYLRNMFAPKDSSPEQRKEHFDQLVFYRMPARQYMDLYRRRSSFLLFDINDVCSKVSYSELVPPAVQALDHYLEGMEYYKSGRYEKAASLFHLAAERENPSAQYLTGLVYLRGRGVNPSVEEAISWFERASARGEPAATNALAWIYATDRHGTHRNGRKAIEYATLACRQAPEHWYPLSTLAAALARNGQFEDAEAAQQRAMSLLRADNTLSAEKKDYYLERGRKRLDLYTNRQPYEE